MNTNPPIRSIRVTFTKPVSATRSAAVLTEVWHVLVAAGLQSLARLWRETTTDIRVENTGHYPTHDVEPLRRPPPPCVVTARTHRYGVSGVAGRVKTEKEVAALLSDNRTTRGKVPAHWVDTDSSAGVRRVDHLRRGQHDADVGDRAWSGAVEDEVSGLQGCSSRQ